MVAVKKLQEAGLGAPVVSEPKKTHGTDKVVQIAQIQLSAPISTECPLSHRGGGLGRLEMGERQSGLSLKPIRGILGQLGDHVDQLAAHQL